MAATAQPAEDRGVGHPRQGERFRCSRCGMELEVTKDCGCSDPNGVHFHCCNQEMDRA
jgi:hypothetical protein